MKKKLIYWLSFVLVIILLLNIGYNIGNSGGRIVNNDKYKIAGSEINKSENQSEADDRSKLINLVGDILEKNENDTYNVSLQFSAENCIKNIYDITDENDRKSILTGEEELGPNVIANYEMNKNINYKFEVEMASGFKIPKQYELVSAELRLGKATKNSDGTYSFPNFEINNPCGDNIKFATIQFASGIQSGDKLTISNIPGATVNTSGTMVSIDLQNQDLDEIQEAVKNNLKVSLVERETGTVDIKAALADEIPDRTINYCASTEHYYEYVEDRGVAWTEAKTKAENRTYSGMHGYLATLTSKEEDEFAQSLITGYGWLGGTCDYNYIFDENGNKIYNSLNDSLWNWYWVTGPEACTKFWDRTGTLNTYTNWASNQPDNARGEYYLHFYTNKLWNDFCDVNSPFGTIYGYIVEYGGMPNDVITLDESYSDVVTISIGLVEPEPTPTPTVVSGIPQIKVGEQTVILTKENVADYYGKVVTNYNQAGATYRLFYVDFDGDFGTEGTVYLKADQVSTTSLNTTASASSTEALNKMKQMNPQWKNGDGIANNNNEKGVLWLCDETKWTNYKDANKSDYVIGAPSVEMYIKSYNAYHGKKGTNGYQKLNCKWFSTNVSGYKYALGDSVIDSSYVYYTDNNILKVDENNMYVKSGQYWWLASPSAYGVDYVCAMGGVLFILNGSTSNYSFGISPLVSLKSDFIPEFAN